MSEIGEVFVVLKQERQAKKMANRESSTKMLAAAAVTFSSHNSGVHLIIHAKMDTVDFWPSTGLWVPRKTKIKRRGILSLLKYLENE